MTDSPAEIMQPSEANNSTSNTAGDIFTSKRYTLSDNGEILVLVTPIEVYS